MHGLQARLVVGTHRFGLALASNLPPPETGAADARRMVLEGFEELGFPLDEADTGLLVVRQHL